MLLPKTRIKLNRRKEQRKLRIVKKSDFRHWDESNSHSFIKFRELVCNHKTFPLHERWLNILQTNQDSKVLNGIHGKNTLILSWRGSSKSTFTLEWIAYQIAKHSHPSINISLKILLVSFNLEVAMLKSEQLQRIIASEAFGKMFPWCRPDPNKWSHGVWAIDFKLAGLPETEEPYTLATCGITGSTASKRSHLIICDDIIPSPDAIENSKIRQKMIDKWEAIIEPTMFDGGRAICLATRMSAKDIFCTTFVQPVWNVIEESALIIDEKGNERSAWLEYEHEPFAQSTEFLLRKRELSPINFSFQYLNKIVKIDTIAINIDWIKKAYLPTKIDRVVVGIDLSAGTREVNDYSVFVVGAYCFNKKTKLPEFYIVDIWRDRLMGNIEKLDALLDLYEKWKHLAPHFECYVESNAYQLSIKGDFDTYILGTKQQYNLSIVTVPSKSDKLARLRGVTGLFQNGLVFFNHFGSNIGAGIDELVNFGSTDHDDICDAIVLALNGMRERSPLTTLDSSKNNRDMI